LVKAHITYHAYNEFSLLISWPDEPVEMISKRAVAAGQIKRLFKDPIAVNHGAYSILVVWENKIDHKVVIALLDKKLVASILLKETRTFWKLPIFYDLEEPIVKVLKNKFTVDEIVKLHQKATYQVDFIGFLPGFPYLKGLDSRLQISRKTTPSLRIAAGSVAISNEYCGIYPSHSPGGWYVLGNCPVDMFNVTRESPSLLIAGDEVTFYSVSKEEKDQLIAQREAGTLELEKFKSHA
jgi:KipI family sensor histidine kinase inhibitor